MSCKDKHCHPYPIEPAPFAPGSCDPHPPCPPRPPRPPMPCAPCPPSQYIGSRYVPIFADPIEWDIHKSYESLTIVTHDGESYTSKCNVGPGIDITNTRYWAKTGAYNAQVEQYKNEVKDLSSQVTGFASDNAEFREKIDQYDKDNAAMKNQVAEDKARVDALAERVSTAETEIDGLQATTAQHTTELANLHAKDEDLQRQITSNDNDIAALQAKDVEHDSRLNGIDTKLRSHDATLAQNTADIAKNVKNIQDNAAAIAVNAHELADHAEQLADHEARLTSQHQEITANHQAIERNTSDIASLRADLTEDEAKIEANRDAIAHIQEKDVQQDGRLDALETEKADKTAIPDVSGFVTQSTYEAGQDTQDERVDALEHIIREKADKTAIPDVSGFVTQTTYDAGQAAQDELLNKLKTEKADKTAIPDVSGFVMQSTYEAGQDTQDERVDALEHAHHYATIEESIKNKGYLNIVDSQVTFTWTPASSSTSAIATLNDKGIKLFVQLPDDTVIDDVNTLPTGTIKVYPIFGFIHEDGTYRTSQDASVISCTFKRVIYSSALHSLELYLTPPWNDINLVQVKYNTTPLFWRFKARYE